MRVEKDKTGGHLAAPPEKPFWCSLVSVVRMQLLIPDLQKIVGSAAPQSLSLKDQPFVVGKGTLQWYSLAG